MKNRLSSFQDPIEYSLALARQIFFLCELGEYDIAWCDDRECFLFKDLRTGEEMVE